MVPDSHFEFEGDLCRYEALLQMADLVAHQCALPELLSELALRLRQVILFELASFSLYDRAKNVMRLHTWHDGKPTHAPSEVPGEDSPGEWVWQNQQPLIISDLEAETRFSAVREILRRHGIRSYCAIPLTTAQEKLGTLGLGSSQRQSYAESDVRLLKSVAELVALAIENAVMRTAFLREKERTDTLLEIGNALIPSLDVRDLFPEISEMLNKVVRHNFASLALHEEATRCLHVCALGSPRSRQVIELDTRLPLVEPLCGPSFLHGEPEIFNRQELAGSSLGTRMLAEGIQSLCCVPIIHRKGSLGTLNLGSTGDNAFDHEDISFLKQVANQVATALDSAQAYREIADLTAKLKHEKLYLQDEIRSVLGFEEIIGESPALRQVLDQVRTVAPQDATVLILGETGTGKELIARAIHRMSSRKDASFIKLNCAAIPTGLLESELFGHERGAFTGAISQKIGRLELADKGTLFLDEVGEIPLELQPKLLRVLQDQEFERLGGVRTIHVNLRLIAATNRNLAKSVAAHEFRDDLYYRLRVFPVQMPPLRERGKDVPLLVRYFVQKFSRRMNKHIENIPTETMNALAYWTWPGNVRELENFIERSLILSEGTTLKVPLAELIPPYEGTSQNFTLEGLEREHILRVLRETGGVIAGLHGAAARLGMKRTTLQSRMQKMGITREEYQN